MILKLAEIIGCSAKAVAEIFSWIGVGYETVQGAGVIGEILEYGEDRYLVQVNAMVDLAESAGIDGVVCSPHELELVSKRESLLSITPGIRLKDSNDDQKRVMIPKEAIDLGANYLVIGRPITQSEDVSEALNTIYESIK